MYDECETLIHHVNVTMFWYLKGGSGQENQIACVI